MGNLLARSGRLARVENDLKHLLDRLQQRWYSETKRVLAFYWLKTLYVSGYELRDWRMLDTLLARLSDADGTLSVLRTWIQQQGLLKSTRNPGPPHLPEVAYPEREPADILLYVSRLLNEWLPKELASLLIEEPDDDEEGIPAMAVGRALERMMIRDQLSQATLQRLLDPSFATPLLLYPLDYELLRDVVLCLLSQTEAPPSPILPATLFYTAPDVKLSENYSEAFRHAFLTQGLEGQELGVPVDPDQTARVLGEDQVRITSVAVTMDGRWWQAYRLKSGDQNTVLYRPVDVLRIDGTNEHVRIRIRWPEARYRWFGDVAFAGKLEIFGRQWTIERWDQDAEQTWITLVFAGVLKPTLVADPAPSRRRARPAAVDMAWTAFGYALQTAIAAKDQKPIEQLRHEELIPLGKALVALSEAMAQWFPPALENLENRLRTVSFHVEQIAPAFGRVPWRVLTPSLQRALLRPRFHQAFGGQLNTIFEDFPATYRTHAA